MSSSVLVEARNKTLVVTIVTLEGRRVYSKGRNYVVDSESNVTLVRPGEHKVFEVDEKKSIVVREITPDDFLLGESS